MALFKPGQSGNPAGRPKGVGKSAMFRRAMERKGKKIVDTVIEKAIAGDPQFCRMIIDRLVPPLRQVDLPAPVPGAASTDHGDQVRAVMTAAIAGTITPSQAADLLSAAANGVRVIEAAEFERRLEALERGAGLTEPPPAPTNGVRSNGVDNANCDDHADH